MSRIRNIKIDFYAKNYNPSSLFEVNANGGVPTTSSVTYSQLDSASGGFDMTVDDTTTLISVTSSNGDCIGTTAQETFYSYPMPPIGPVRLGSSGSLTTAANYQTPLGLAYDPIEDDVYIHNWTGVVRRHNKTGELYDNSGPFDNDPYSMGFGDICYIDKTRCIALTADSDPCLRIFSMSGDLLYTSSISEPLWLNGKGPGVSGLQNDSLKLAYDGNKYLYGTGKVCRSGSTDADAFTFYRFDVDTLSFDETWYNNLITGSSDIGYVDYILPLSGSTDEAVVVVGGDVNRIHRMGSGSYMRVIGNSSGQEDIANAALMSDGNVVIAGKFDTLRRIDKDGTQLGPNHTIYNLAKLNADDLDPSPFTSSFNANTVPIFRNIIYSFVETGVGVTRTVGKGLAVDSNDNIIVGGIYFGRVGGLSPAWEYQFVTQSMVNVGGATNPHTSYVVFDSTGSYRGDWNYATESVTVPGNQSHSWCVYRLYVQPDDSYYMFTQETRGFFTIEAFQPTGSKFNDETVVGELFFSSSGILVDKIAP